MDAEIDDMLLAEIASANKYINLLEAYRSMLNDGAVRTPENMERLILATRANVFNIQE